MDTEARELERRWRESGDEADQHAWLCARLRGGWGDELASELSALERAVAQAYFGPEDVIVSCGVGWQTEGETPRQRLAAFSHHRGWRPAPRPAQNLADVLDVTTLARLFPHEDYDVSDVGWRFQHLFAEGSHWINYEERRHGNSWGRSVWAFPARVPDDWEVAQSSAYGAVLGPLVAYVAVTARDSI